MHEKIVVTVSRKWNSPHIEVTLNNTEIRLQMSMDDFQEALLAELDSVATTFTKKGLREKLYKAIDKVVHGIKEESIKVVE